MNRPCSAVWPCAAQGMEKRHCCVKAWRVLVKVGRIRSHHLSLLGRLLGYTYSSSTIKRRECRATTRAASSIHGEVNRFSVCEVIDYCGLYTAPWCGS